MHAEALLLTRGRLRPVRLPCHFGLLEHPREGLVLFDTGYAPRVGRGTWPGRVYRALAPFFVDEEGAAAGRLRARGIDPGRIRHVVISHFHPDHIGGLRDFPNATFHARREALRRVQMGRGLRRLTRGYFPELLPEDFHARVRWVGALRDAGLGPFEGTADLFGDGSLRLLALPGHAAGQLGALATLADARQVLFAADACWSSRGYKELRLPSAATRLIVHDRRAERSTLERLHALHLRDPALHIVPAHCPSIEEMEFTCA
ncbi:MAG: MBL fold metallo-hydrolase [Alphaproteobacteria bacterium]|nr:MBL fold metallo-hydrolase [Alphaproteobacteria bacterium]